MKSSKIIITRFSRVQLLETGLVLVLLSVILGIVRDEDNWLIVAVFVAGTGLVVPRLFYPVAVVWFSLGNLLSLVVSPLLLTLVFMLIITPIGLIRRWLGHDSLQLKKSTDTTTFHLRNHTFTAADLKNSF